MVLFVCVFNSKPSDSIGFDSLKVGAGPGPSPPHTVTLPRARAIGFVTMDDLRHGFVSLNVTKELGLTDDHLMVILIRTDLGQPAHHQPGSCRLWTKTHARGAAAIDPFLQGRLRATALIFSAPGMVTLVS